MTEVEPEVDTSSSMDATRATTPSMTGDGEMDEIIDFDKSCSITAVSEPVSTTSSEIQIRDSSPNLVHPPSDSMDVDAEISVTDVVPNPTRKIAEVLEPSTSKPWPGVPAKQFYGSQKPGDVKPVVIMDSEDSGEDQQQEAEVDDMLAETQSPAVDLSPQYVAL
jgi:hypothetical protein